MLQDPLVSVTVDPATVQAWAVALSTTAPDASRASVAGAITARIGIGSTVAYMRLQTDVWNAGVVPAGLQVDASVRRLSNRWRRRTERTQQLLAISQRVRKKTQPANHRNHCHTRYCLNCDEG